MTQGNSMPSVYIEAEYADGYVHREDAQDHSPYISGKNIFSDILESRPVPAHGPLIRFSLVTPDAIYNIEWTALPRNARPIRFKHMERESIGGEWVEEPRIVRIDFGYQYTDDDGKNVQHVTEIP